MSVLFIAALQGAAFFGISAAATAFTKFAVYALSLSGLYAREGNAPFLSMTFPVAFIDIPPPHLTDILLCMGVGVGIIVALRLYPSRTPAYYVLVTGALIVVASAAQLLLMGRPSYEAGDFSSAVLRTSLLIWALAPTLLGVVSLLFPFRLRERAALLLLASAIDFFFSIARYAVVLGVLATVGPIALPSALIFAGPILDALVYVAVFSSSLAALSRRLSLSPELWRWSLH